MKASYRRYAKVGPGGITCPCCGGPAQCRKLIKKAARRSFARITDLLVQDELTPEPQPRQPKTWETYDAYDAWDDSYIPDSVEPYDHTAYLKSRAESIIMSSNGYDVIPDYNVANQWYVEMCNSDVIGVIKMTGFEWEVTFGFGRSTATYTFDYMESSLEAAFALIQTLHRIDCGSEV